MSEFANDAALLFFVGMLVFAVASVPYFLARYGAPKYARRFVKEQSIPFTAFQTLGFLVIAAAGMFALHVALNGVDHIEWSILVEGWIVFGVLFPFLVIYRQYLFRIARRRFREGPPKAPSQTTERSES